MKLFLFVAMLKIKNAIPNTSGWHLNSHFLINYFFIPAVSSIIAVVIDFGLSIG